MRNVGDLGKSDINRQMWTNFGYILWLCLYDLLRWSLRERRKQIWLLSCWPEQLNEMSFTKIGNAGGEVYFESKITKILF
jgi:hypothetical protein